MSEPPDIARRARREIRLLRALRPLPLPVARWQWRAHRLARRTRDDFSLASATRPPKLMELLMHARGRRRVVELGTATAWTTLSLLIDDPQRLVWSFDPHPHPRRDAYIELVAPEVRRRMTLLDRPGEVPEPGAAPVDLLYIDSSHDRAGTIAEVRAWRPYLAPGAVVVFDDYGHPDYPGVREAIEELRLTGEAREGLWIHVRAEAGEDPA